MMPEPTANATLSRAPDGGVYAIPSADARRTAFAAIDERAQAARAQGREVVVVQGLGFVGAAVAACVAAARDANDQPRFFVIGLDLATPGGYWKVARIGEGLAPIASPDPDLPTLIDDAVLKTGNLCATTEAEALGLADVIVVDIHLDVADPARIDAADIDVNVEPFRKAMHDVGRHMAADALVLIETTVPIGTTEKIVRPALTEERTARAIAEPVLLAHAYERVMPGPAYVRSIREFWRSYAASDDASAQRAEAFLSAFIDTAAYPLYRLEGTEASEMAKLLENSYRAANIAFIHEWTLLAEKIGVNLFEVVNSIRVRKGTHDNMRLPGFGVGGYCLTKDSLLAQWAGDHLFGANVTLEMTLQGLRVNRAMPLHVQDLLGEALGDLKGKTIAILGVSYMAGLDDTRNTPTEILFAALEAADARPRVHDPLVRHWAERPDVDVFEDLGACLQDADAIVFAVPHADYGNLQTQDVAAAKAAIIDAFDIIDDAKAAGLHGAGCKVLGVGKGHWRKRGYERGE